MAWDERATGESNAGQRDNRMNPSLTAEPTRGSIERGVNRITNKKQQQLYKRPQQYQQKKKQNKSKNDDTIEKKASRINPSLTEGPTRDTKEGRQQDHPLLSQQDQQGTSQRDEHA